MGVRVPSWVCPIFPLRGSAWGESQHAALPGTSLAAASQCQQPPRPRPWSQTRGALRRGPAWVGCFWWGEKGGVLGKFLGFSMTIVVG